MLTLATSLGSVLYACAQLNCPSAGTACAQELGPPSANGEDGRLGYDINAGTGNLYLLHTDIEAQPALGPVLRFERFYNSQGNGADIGLGANWTHSYSSAISVAGTVASIVRDTGQLVQFTLVAGSWVPQVGEFGSLTGTTIAGFNYTTSHGTQYVFDTTANSGRLLSVTPPDDTAISVAYSSGTKVSSVSSGTLSLTFSYTGAHITAVSDPIGQTWAYGYTGANLTSVTFPNNDGSGHYGETQYQYSNVTVGTTTFNAGTSAGQLTEVEALVSAGVWAPFLYFSYLNPVVGSSQAVAAASGYDGTNLLKYVTLSYNLCAGGTFTTTATFPVGTSSTKTVTSTATSAMNLPRLTSIASTGGVGSSTESTAETYTWNANLTLASFTNGNGSLSQISSYDSKGNPTTIVEASGTSTARTTTFTYHPVLSTPLTVTRLSVDGSHNHVITFDYDSDYDSTYNSSPTNYLYQVIESGYTDLGLAGGLGTQQVRTTQIYYDANHRKTKIRTPVILGVDAGFEGADFGYYSSGVYANYRSAVSEYTSASSALTTTYNSYDGDGRLTSVTDPNGTATVTTLNPIGLILTSQVTQGSASLVNSFTFDLAGDLLTHTTPEGALITTEYDGALRAWRSTAQVAAGGSAPWSTVYSYDAWNNPVVVRTFSGPGSFGDGGCASTGTEQLCKEMSYDSYRRLSAERTLDSSNNACAGSDCEVLYTYDNDGHVSSRSEAGLNTYTFYRDGLDRVVKVLLPTGFYSTVSYDSNDRLLTRFDPRSSANGGSGGLRETTFVNDDFGHMVKMVSPNVGTQISNYDLFGNVVSSKDASGARLNYSYDGLNRRTSIDGGVRSEIVSYAYDQSGAINGSLLYSNTVGRLTSVVASDSVGHVIASHYTYDFVGRTLANVEERGDAGSTTTAAVQYAWGNNGEPVSLTYPDGLILTYKYPTDGGFAPTPMANELDVPFQGASTPLVSNVNYFADGSLASLSFGNGSIRSITRNHRGEWTSLTSGPTGAPVLSQSYTYDAHGLGELKDITYFPGQTYAWDWTFGYDALRRLTSYSTDVRSVTDNYSWTYDEVSNRSTQVYNSATTTYTYDTAKNTSQLSALSGATSRSWTYDANGSVSQDHTTGVSSTWNQYVYGTRHVPSRIDLYASSVFQYTQANYQNDGENRRWSTVAPQAGGTWTQFYYDETGRTLEEYQNNNITVNSCPAYDVIDHIYLGGGAGEVSRLVRRFQSSGGGCSAVHYNFVDLDVRYVHQDYRRTVYGVESKTADGGLVYLTEIDPFGNVVHESSGAGPDHKNGTPDDLIATVVESTGRRETHRDNLNTSLQAAPTSSAVIPSVDMTLQPSESEVDILYMTPYGATVLMPGGRLSGGFTPTLNGVSAKQSSGYTVDIGGHSNLLYGVGNGGGGLFGLMGMQTPSATFGAVGGIPGSNISITFPSQNAGAEPGWGFAACAGATLAATGTCYAAGLQAGLDVPNDVACAAAALTEAAACHMGGEYDRDHSTAKVDPNKDKTDKDPNKKKCPGSDSTGGVIVKVGALPSSVKSALTRHFDDSIHVRPGPGGGCFGDDEREPFVWTPNDGRGPLALHVLTGDFEDDGSSRVSASAADRTNRYIDPSR